MGAFKALGRRHVLVMTKDIFLAKCQIEYLTDLYYPYIDRYSRGKRQGESGKALYVAQSNQLLVDITC